MICNGSNEQKGGSVCVCTNTYACVQACVHEYNCLLQCNGHDRDFTHIF